MTGLFKYWFGKESALRSISNKPLSVTFKDATILIILTLIVTLTIMLIYYTVVDTPDHERKWFTLTWQTALSTGILAITYEYIGLNNMLAESSIRYSRGTTLAKYVSRRDAMLYQCLYKLIQSPKYNVNSDNIKKNFRILKAIVNQPNLRGKLADIAGDTRAVERIKAKYPKKAEIISIITELPTETVAALDTIGDRLSEDIVYDILVYGFDGYKHGNNGMQSLIATTLDGNTVARAVERGGRIASELIELEDNDD